MDKNNILDDNVETTLLQNDSNSESTDSNIGKIIANKYQITQKIGSGGMSNVYLVVDKMLGKQWALKVLRNDKDTQSNTVAYKAMLDEAHLMSKLDHPALPRIVEIIEEKDNALYVVMDYIEGQNLSQVLKQSGPQPQDVVIDWAKQLASILGYLHSQETPIVYRDMKPSNIILKNNGQLCVIDLGISREYKKESLEDTVCVGTFGYAAPEQFGGKGQSDPRTDIYALGVTLHYLVTGKNPAEPPFDLKPIRQFNSKLSARFEKIITKCTEYNPQDRYSSCQEVMDDLDRLDKPDNKNAAVIISVISAVVLISVLLAVLLVIGIKNSDKNTHMPSTNSDIYQIENTNDDSNLQNSSDVTSINGDLSSVVDANSSNSSNKGTSSNNSNSSGSNSSGYAGSGNGSIGSSGGGANNGTGGSSNSGNGTDNTSSNNTGNGSSSNLKVVTNTAQILNDISKLGKNETTPYIAQLTGKVISIDKAYNSSFGSVSVTIQVGGKNIQCYNMKGTGTDKVKVGDTITVRGVIKNFYYDEADTSGTVEFTYDAASQTEVVMTKLEPSKEVAKELSVVDAPKVGVAYKFGFFSTAKNTTYYAAGGMNGYYMSITTSPSAAIDVYLENANGGYYLYTMIDGRKKYMIMESTGNHVNAFYSDKPGAVLKYDAEKKTLVVNATKNGEEDEYAFGTWGDYFTIGATQTSKDGYFCHFYGGNQGPLEFF